MEYVILHSPTATHRNAEWLANERQARVQPLMAYGLTPREMEIAHWLTVGKTNAETAAILAARPRTMEKHMEAILQKLGAENRPVAATVIAAACVG